MFGKWPLWVLITSVSVFLAIWPPLFAGRFDFIPIMMATFAIFGLIATFITLRKVNLPFSASLNEAGQAFSMKESASEKSKED